MYQKVHAASPSPKKYCFPFPLLRRKRPLWLGILLRPSLNFESIGPAQLTHDLVLLGAEESPLSPYFIAAAAAQGRTIFFDSDNSDGWFFRSDHYNFVKKGVPAVVWENGLQPVDPSRPNKYPMPVWYHKPSDEYKEDWDLSGTLANVNLVFSVGLSLANGKD